MDKLAYRSPLRAAVCSLIVFVLFLSYYSVSSNLLPLGAGPDNRANNDAVGFIYKYQRLAVLPRDEDKLYFSMYGGTRALRPPLAYIVSAAAAKVLDSRIDDPRILFRKGSSLLAAATVAVVFYTALLYFDSYSAGILAAFLFGLLPQFAFIASYNNDDSGAIFSATVLLCILVRILKRGFSWPNIVLFGIAGGLVILSKQTAWLLAPTALLFLAFYLRAPWKQLLKYAAVVVVVFVLSGGWWILFNMYHYGPGDPVALKEEAAMAATHSRLPPERTLGYAPSGVRYIDLVLGNYDDFWGKTMASTIGNLDWMRLRVGPLQYGLYLVLFGLGAIYAALRIGALINRRAASPGAHGADRVRVFEALLAFAVVFQFCMYTWANMHNDVQLQGKYLLPVFLAAVLLGISGARRLVGRVVPILTTDEPRDVRISGRFVQTAALVASVVVVVAVHADAAMRYVVPFYRPPGFRVDGELQSVSISERDILHKNQLHGFKTTGTGFVLDSDGVDPWFTVDLSRKKTCGLFRGHNILEARIKSNTGGAFKVYVDRGHGIREEDSYETRYDAGDDDIILLLDVRRCSRLRIDPANRAGHIEVSRLSLARVVLRN